MKQTVGIDNNTQNMYMRDKLIIPSLKHITNANKGAGFLLGRGGGSGTTPFSNRENKNYFPYQLNLDVSVYHVNSQEGSPSHFSNKSCQLIIILPDYDNQFVHVIIK